MDQEKILREILKITKENNEMIYAIDRQRRRGNIFFIIKWVLIISLAYGTYIFSIPYIDRFQDFVSGLTNVSSVGNVLNQRR